MFARSILFTAFRSGGLVGVIARPSRRSPTGVVVAPVFATLPAALRFAGTAAAHAGGRFPSVRPVPGRSGARRFSVSVPVAGPALPPSVRLAVRGLRGAASVPAACATLATLGFQ